MRFLYIILFFTSLLNANVNVVCKAGIMDNESAKKYINNILKKEPENVKCILKLASVYLKSGDILKGYIQIAKAYSIDPVSVKKSEFNTVLSSAKESLTLLNRAKIKNNSELWNRFGDYFFEMGAFKDATIGYSNSLKINKKQPHIAIKLALSQQRSNQVIEAVNTLRELLKIEEDNFYATYYLAKILRYNLRDQIESYELFLRAKTILEVKQDEFKKDDYISLQEALKEELQ